MLINHNLADSKTTYIDSETCLNLWRNHLLDKSTNFKNLALQLQYLNHVIGWSIGDYALNMTYNLILQFLCKDLIIYILSLVDRIEFLNVINSINNRAMNRDRDCKIFKTRIKNIEIRDGKLYLTTFCEVRQICLLFLEHSSLFCFASQAFLFFYFLL